VTAEFKITNPDATPSDEAIAAMARLLAASIQHQDATAGSLAAGKGDDKRGDRSQEH
jgi:hypothetical protein